MHSLLRRTVLLLPLNAVLPCLAQSQEDAFTSALIANRHAVTLDATGTLGETGGDLLVAGGREARFFLIGEEHGVAQIPVLTAALFRALAPHGYRHLAIETGDGVAREMNRLLLGVNGDEALRRFFIDHFPGVPFYTLSEEAALLSDAVRLSGGREDVLWGLDYDILADRWPLRRLRDIAPDAAARAAAERAIDVADSLLAAALAQRNPGLILMFGGPDSIVSALRAAYRPSPGSEAHRILRLMSETIGINQHWVSGDGFASNLRRARFNKEQLWHHWTEADRTDGEPRVMFKFGASHTVRGRSFTDVLDIGTLASEIAEARGERSFHVLVMGGHGTQHAVMDPTVLAYRSAPAGMAAAEWSKPLIDAADPERWTLFDMRPLRPLLSANRLGALPSQLRQVIWGFDAVVVLAESTASTGLQLR